MKYASSFFCRQIVQILKYSNQVRNTTSVSFWPNNVSGMLIDNVSILPVKLSTLLPHCSTRISLSSHGIQENPDNSQHLFGKWWRVHSFLNKDSQSKRFTPYNFNSTYRKISSAKVEKYINKIQDTSLIILRSWAAQRTSNPWMGRTILLHSPVILYYTTQSTVSAV